MHAIYIVLLMPHKSEDQQLQDSKTRQRSLAQRKRFQCCSAVLSLLLYFFFKLNYKARLMVSVNESIFAVAPSLWQMHSDKITFP